LNYTRDAIFDFRFSVADCNSNKILSAKLTQHIQFND